MDRDDPSRFRFFETMKRAQAERMERIYGDVEEKKRWMLRCATGGGMRHHSKRRPKITLPTLSWERGDK